MKRILAMILTMFLLSTVMAVPVLATESTEEVITFADGSYAIIETTEVTAAGNARTSTVSKSGSRKFTMYSGDDVKQWDYTLYGTFLYRYGIGAQAQNRSDTYNIYDSYWSLVSHDTSLDMDTVYGVVTMKCTVLFITVETHTQNLSISCDMYGNLTYGNLADPG